MGKVFKLVFNGLTGNHMDPVGAIHAIGCVINLEIRSNVGTS